MPQGLQQFLEDVTATNPVENGVEFAAGTPRLRVTAVAQGVFQVRFSPDGTPFREPPFSYAVVPDYFSTHHAGAQVNTEAEGSTRITCGGFTAVIHHNPLRVSFEDEHGNVFADDRFGISWRGDKVAVWKNKIDGEHFYGMGERAVGINRSTHKLVNWNTDAPAYQEWSDPLYASFPFFMALRPCQDQIRRAYGIYLDNSYRSEFDFGGEMLEGVDFCIYGGELVYYVIMGPDMTDVLRRYTEMTGRAPLPPKWALGYQQSRWSYYPESEVRTLVRQFRERKIPLDVLYLDIHYMEGYRVFTWDPERFPDPPRLMHDLREQGVKVVTIIDPGIKADVGYFVNEEGLAQNMFVKYPDGHVYTGSVWPGACHFPDFTSPKVRAWFGSYCNQMTDDGVAGMWTDMNEPSNHRFRTLPDIVRHDFEGEGGTHAEAHNVYGLLMARATYEGLREHTPEERPFVLTRAGFSGVQRYAAMWTGDNVSDWEHLRLTTSMLLSLGMSGMPFAGSDVGGFFDSPSPELFARWIQLGAFSPLFRTHTIFHSRLQEPWSFGPSTETVARKFIELRYRLLPVFYTLFDEHRRTGLPVIRPMVLHYPQDARVHDMDDQFLLGHNVLVAPILVEGARSRNVYLPEGTWYDFWTGQALHDGTKAHHEPVLFAALLEEMPLFIREGTVLPLAPVEQYVGQHQIRGLELRVFPGNGTSHLYEDDGVSHAYEHGDFRRTTFTLERTAEHHYMLRRTHEGSYRSHLQHFNVHIFGVDEPGEVLIDGRALPVQQTEPEEEQQLDELAVYFPDHGTLRFHAPAGFDRIDFTA